ncbi:lysylphosphatidylglycerol synthase transmembrane domain-containing protein [uncultured Acetobacteroides sp.]|uniref:lysylphosphatidylglycerol synthase transmembrane domain-containing protein n=1 Tax=uncultured Acetobacteroides sp. TaxID=1760811 RepID=UPI0029F490A5|nr:lysylphosphatidylglycerol synthase transmembrane domain-containing protein [uncultured Acetobacteroides sp.]
MKKGTLLRGINITVFFGLGVVLMYFAFKNVKFDFLMEGLRGANYSWLVISLLLGNVAFLARALRWRLLIEPLGYQPSVMNSFHAITIGYLANFAFPRAGEVSRCGVLRKTEKIPFESLVGTVIVERTFDLLCLLILLTAVFFFKVDSFGKFIYDTALLPITNKFAGFGGSYLAMLIVMLPIATALFVAYVFRYKLIRYGVIRKMIRLSKGVVNGLKTGFTMERRLEFLLFTLLIWASYLTMTWAVFYTLPATSTLGIVDALFILAISSIGMAVPVQGGFGAFHIIVAMGLTMYGISREDGLLYATISHESQAIMTIIIGVISLSYLFFKKRNNPVIATSHEQIQER